MEGAAGLEPAMARCKQAALPAWLRPLKSGEVQKTLPRTIPVRTLETFSVDFLVGRV